MADGEAAYQVRADGSQGQAEKKIEKSALKSGQEIKSASGEPEKTIKDSMDSLNTAIQKNAQQASQSAQKVADSASKIGAAFQAAGKIAGNALAAIGKAAVSAGTKAVSSAGSLDKAMGQFAASTGTAQKKLDAYEGVLKNIYANNYGESFEEVGGALSQIRTEIGGVVDSWEPAALQEFTESAFALRDTFGYDISESVRAAHTLMDQFGIDGQAAFDLVASGAQNGLDRSGALLDNINEYSAQFAKAGLDAEGMFQIFQKSADTGAFQLDEMGAMWEELGPQAVTALAGIEDGIYSTGTAMDAIKADKYSDLGSMFSQLESSVEVLLLPLGEGLIPLLQEILESIMPALQENLPILTDSLVGIVSSLSPVVAEILPQLVNLVSAMLPLFLQMIEEILPPLLGLFTQLISPLLELVSTLLPPLLSLFSALIVPLAEILEAILPPLVEILNTLLQPIIGLVNQLLPPLASLLSGIAPLFGALTPLISQVAGLIANNLGAAIGLVMPVIENLMGILNSLITFVTGVFSGNWEQAWDGIVGIFRGIFNQIPSLIEGILNGAIGMINGLISGINTLTGAIGIPAIPSIPKVTLPRFHMGGIVDFAVGEAPALLKDGEMVLTQQQQARLFAIANGDSMGGSSSMIVVQSPIYMDGRLITNTVTRHQYNDVMAKRYKG